MCVKVLLGPQVKYILKWTKVSETLGNVRVTCHVSRFVQICQILERYAKQFI